MTNHAIMVAKKRRAIDLGRGENAVAELTACNRRTERGDEGIRRTRRVFRGLPYAQTDRRICIAVTARRDEHYLDNIKTKENDMADNTNKETINE